MLMPDTHGVVRRDLAASAVGGSADRGCDARPGRLQPISTGNGYADQCKTQLQFFAPPGAVRVGEGCPPRSHQVATYGAFGNRLEQSPEEFAVFNLSPGRYEFKYVAAEGLPARVFMAS